ncbi:unnamed protein product [Phytophthora fragariaefolia]|uniref:Unnamed protein product n=1 Tax=Phytophthora fragariaefolia TaxID=1490495 RepID=A0A9W6WZF8_9STRA|nr:unnamed protein product [Phytophthora fragariaefolia]
MKDRLRGYCVNYLREQIRDYHTSNSRETFKMVAPQRGTIVGWVVRAWDHLPRAMIPAGFQKCLLVEVADDSVYSDPEMDSEMQTLVNDVVKQLESLDAFADIEWDDIIDSS